MNDNKDIPDGMVEITFRIGRYANRITGPVDNLNKILRQMRDIMISLIQNEQKRNA